MKRFIEKRVKELRSDLEFAEKMYADLKQQTDKALEYKCSIEKRIAELTDNASFKKFVELKAAHPDCLILFRCGDFYELVEEDAVYVSATLGLTLNMDMGVFGCVTGFPNYALDEYLPKILRNGKRIAIVDEIKTI